MSLTLLVLADPSASDFQRAVAAARSGDAAKARSSLAKIDPTEAVRRALVEATLALRAKDLDAALAAYARAYAKTKTAYPGDPKTSWATPVGEGYGAALLAAGKPAEAETVFTAELERFPNDPHLEWGLAEALAELHQDDAAPRASYRAHWKGSSDLTLDRLG